MSFKTEQTALREIAFLAAKSLSGRSRYNLSTDTQQLALLLEEAGYLIVDQLDPDGTIGAVNPALDPLTQKHLQ